MDLWRLGEGVPVTAEKVLDYLLKKTRKLNFPQ